MSAQQPRYMVATANRFAQDLGCPFAVVCTDDNWQATVTRTFEEAMQAADQMNNYDPDWIGNNRVGGWQRKEWERTHA